MLGILAKITGYSVVLLLLLALFYYAVATMGGFEPKKIAGRSMEPTLKTGMFVMTQKTNVIQRGDIVVYTPPQRREIEYIQRVIGLPGDTVEIKSDGKVYLNGRQYTEEYLYPNTFTSVWQNEFMALNQTVVIPNNSYFLLGDNRQQASDSRKFGTVNIADIHTKYLFCYWHCR